MDKCGLPSLGSRATKSRLTCVSPSLRSRQTISDSVAELNDHDLARQWDKRVDVAIRSSVSEVSPSSSAALTRCPPRLRPIQASRKKVHRFQLTLAGPSSIADPASYGNSLGQDRRPRLAQPLPQTHGRGLPRRRRRRGAHLRNLPRRRLHQGRPVQSVPRSRHAAAAGHTRPLD
jgi:hypothetical protein